MHGASKSTTATRWRGWSTTCVVGRSSTHTVVPLALEGHGIAGRLARAALDYARDRGLSVVPLCPYVADYIGKHPEYEDLVAGEDRESR